MVIFLEEEMSVCPKTMFAWHLMKSDKVLVVHFCNWRRGHWELWGRGT